MMRGGISGKKTSQSPQSPKERKTSAGLRRAEELDLLTLTLQAESGENDDNNEFLGGDKVDIG